LESCGYEVQPILLPACAVNAPHRRDRIWFVAYSKNIGQPLTKTINKWREHQSDNRNEIWNTSNTDGISRNATNTEYSRRREELSFDRFPTQSPICGGDDGIPTELDGITFSKWRNESIKAYGNAIVPQVAFEIFKAIQQCDDTML
jgi:DNA (cytosine-5)-methyltransferase 1